MQLEKGLLALHTQIDLMSERQPEREEVSVVLLGSFNPGIFHPEWFRRQEILLPAEAEGAKTKVVSGDFTEIRFLDLKLDVLPDRFILRTNDVSRAEKLQDVMLATLRLLHHTPVTACGINNEITFDLKNEHYWHSIGHSLAPKDTVWNQVLEKPGMQSLTIRGLRGGNFPGTINITVQPATVQGISFGLSVKSNSHYDVPKDGSGIPDIQKVVGYLQDEWKSALQQTRKSAAQIFSAIPESK